MSRGAKRGFVEDNCSPDWAESCFSLRGGSPSFCEVWTHTYRDGHTEWSLWFEALGLGYLVRIASAGSVETDRMPLYDRWFATGGLEGQAGEPLT